METIFNRNLMENHPSGKFIEAKKKVDKIKGFYKHVAVYVVINILLIITKTSILNYFINEGNKDPGFLSWLKMNIWVTPVLWAIGLVIHGLVVFKFQNITLYALINKKVFTISLIYTRISKFNIVENCKNIPSSRRINF